MPSLIAVLVAVATVIAAIATGERWGQDALGQPLAEDSFSGDGRVVIDYGGRDAGAAVAIQPDGRFVVAGVSSGPDGAAGRAPSIVVERRLADGSPDRRFGTDGRVTASGSGAGGLAARRDGRIVVLGHADADGAVVIRQMLADGSPDPSFGGGDGSATVRHAEDLDPECPFFAEALAIVPDGGLVLVGSTGCGGVTENGVSIVVARLRADGTLDRAFDDDGTKELSVGICGRGTSTAIDGAGRILVGATDANCMTGDRWFHVVRLQPNGRVDRAFGRRGHLRVRAAGSMSMLVDMAFDARDRLVLFGTSGESEARGAFALARLTPDGRPDRTFGVGGVAVARRHARRGVDVTAGSVLADGRLAVVGTVAAWDAEGYPAAGTEGRIAVFGSDGAIDTSFARYGVRAVRFAGRGDGAFDVAAGMQRHLIVAGVADARGASGSDVGIAAVAHR